MNSIKRNIDAIKREILARPPIPYVPMTPERRDELLGHLERNLAREATAEELAEFWRNQNE